VCFCMGNCICVFHHFTSLRNGIADDYNRQGSSTPDIRT
jgi:hypothetical protein